MQNGEIAGVLSDALLLRCDRCENKTCGYFGPSPIDSMCDAVDSEYNILELSSGNLSSFIDWASHGFCAYEVAQWYENGVLLAERAHQLLKVGISLSEMKSIVSRAIQNQRRAEAYKKEQ